MTDRSRTRARPGEGFEIEVSGPGLFDLKFDGRAVCYDREMDEIRREITRMRKPGSPVTMIGLDGYRESLN